MRLALLAGVLLVSLQAMSQQQLASLRDHNRVLLVFAPDGQDTRFRTQLTNLDGQQMAERDLLLVPVLGKWDRLDDDLRAAHVPFTKDSEQASIRSRFHIPLTAFTVILLGKDGGEKLRSHTPITTAQLNLTIDAMPMRQQEIQSRNPR